MIDKILLVIANIPHKNMKIFDVIGQKPFSAEKREVCTLTQLNMLHAVDRLMMVSGCRPKIASFSNIVSKPPVVAVAVLEMSIIMICNVT